MCILIVRSFVRSLDDAHDDEDDDDDDNDNNYDDDDDVTTITTPFVIPRNANDVIYHASTMPLPCLYHASAMPLPCLYHAVKCFISM